MSNETKYQIDFGNDQAALIHEQKIIRKVCSSLNSRFKMDKPIEQVEDVLSTLAEQTQKSYERSLQQMDSFPNLRLEFFGRIVLLDGGTVALSVTLIGSLSARFRIHYVPMMIISWAMFLISMILGLSRNWFEHERMRFWEGNRFRGCLTVEQDARIRFSKLNESQKQTLREEYDLNKAALDEENRKRMRMEARIRTLGAVSLIAGVLGFFLLLLFGSANLVLATRF